VLIAEKDQQNITLKQHILSPKKNSSESREKKPIDRSKRGKLPSQMSLVDLVDELERNSSEF
jgi:hypothetical protein